LPQAQNPASAGFFFVGGFELTIPAAPSFANSTAEPPSSAAFLPGFTAAYILGA
jgi:hypothetical protein